MSFQKTARHRLAQYLAVAECFSEAARARIGMRKSHGHLLAPGHHWENLYPPLRGPDGTAAQFFRERGIKWWRSARCGDEKGQDGPTRNLASSQVACVNFLLPLKDNPEALAAILRSLDPDVREVVPLVYQSRHSATTVSSFVEFEWVGLDKSLEGTTPTRGANATSADALIVAKTAAGTRRAYLIEWKYVEEYTEKAYKGEGDSGKTRRKRYEELYSSADSPFNGQASLDEMMYEPFYQLMRLGLLGSRMTEKGEFEVSEARVLVVCPDDNTAYRDRITSPALLRQFSGYSIIQVMDQLTKANGFYRLVAQDDLLDSALVAGNGQLKTWNDYHRARYSGR